MPCASADATRSKIIKSKFIRPVIYPGQYHGEYHVEYCGEKNCRHYHKALCSEYCDEYCWQYWLMWYLILTQYQTRMHSSRMRTGRSLTVCWSLLPGGCLLRRGACSGGGSAPGRVPALEGSAPGGLLLGGVCSGGGGCLLPGGWYPSMHWGRPPPVDRITDTSKKITLATTSLRSVNRYSVTS